MYKPWSFKLSFLKLLCFPPLIQLRLAGCSTFSNSKSPCDIECFFFFFFLLLLCWVHIYELPLSVFTWVEWNQYWLKGRPFPSKLNIRMFGRLKERKDWFSALFILSVTILGFIPLMRVDIDLLISVHFSLISQNIV